MRTLHSAVVLTLSLMICIPLFSQSVLYTSKAYTVYSDRVVQDKFVASAYSRTELSTNYQSNYRKQTNRNISFKFCINGLDNERMPGQDHHITIMQKDGKFVTPVYEFGKSDPVETNGDTKNAAKFLDEDINVIFRVDMREVLKEFSAKGFFTTYSSEKISAEDFKGVYLAGDVSPLTWNFATLISKPEMKLEDPDNDGIYEVTIPIKRETYPGRFSVNERHWKLSKEISTFPQYESSQLLVDALYNLSLEEMMLNVRPDGALMAGESWPGVWTRDISYSIILSLAVVNPDASKISLLAKVKNGRIIQDTGTGGSWPVSTDRMVWALAAWEVYAVTGDQEWLKQSYAIIKNSAEDDLLTAYDEKTKLFYGESSFLDWREQTYPRWMDPKDIYQSKNLGTNVVHYQTYRILAKMAKILGEDSRHYTNIAEEVKKSINTMLWDEQQGNYGQYLYGRNYPVLSSRTETLGAALAILYDVADGDRQQKVIKDIPVANYGASCIYPQIPNIPPYHNNAVWSFVETYRAWASAKAENSALVTNALASIYRSAALFQTNKENFVAETGDFMGTEINSNRQLWSVAGTLATIYRVLFGMQFTDHALILSPFIPKEYDGERTLKNFKYRNAVIDISIYGFGNRAESVLLDGKPIKRAELSGDLQGKHTLKITLSGKLPRSSVNIVNNIVSPETPVVKLGKNTLQWEPLDGAVKYLVYRNGEKVASTKNNEFTISDTTQFAEYQVKVINDAKIESFLSEPVAVVPSDKLTILSAAENENDYVQVDKTKQQTILKSIVVPIAGSYTIDVLYANGNGPINTDNKCAIRTLVIDGKNIASVVMPQRGENNWNEFGYSNSITVPLTKGHHSVSLVFSSSNNNMNGEINTALVKHFRLTLLKESKDQQ